MTDLIFYLRNTARALPIMVALTMTMSCAPPLPLPAAADVSPGAISNMSDLRKGRTLYIHNCAGCHNLRSPSDYSPLEWKKAMVMMQMKARIETATKDSILAYLLGVTRKPDY